MENDDLKKTLIAILEPVYLKPTYCGWLGSQISRCMRETEQAKILDSRYLFDGFELLLELNSQAYSIVIKPLTQSPDTTDKGSTNETDEDKKTT